MVTKDSGRISALKRETTSGKKEQDIAGPP